MRRVERGSLNVNEDVEIIGIQDKSISTTVTGIEMFRKRRWSWPLNCFRRSCQQLFNGWEP